jgi:hypothetical protein
MFDLGKIFNHQQLNPFGEVYIYVFVSHVVASWFLRVLAKKKYIGIWKMKLVCILLKGQCHKIF